MKKNTLLTIFIILGFCLAVIACNPKSPAAPQKPPAATNTSTTDVNATVAAAISATDAAKVKMQSTIDAAVAQTNVANPTVLSTNPPVTAAPPTPAPVTAESMTEEELIDAIDAAVNTAMVAAEETATIANQAASDGAVTAQEAQAVQITVSASGAAILQAEQLATDYLAIYGELGGQAMAEFSQLESDLAAISQSTATMATTVDQINQLLQQGANSVQEGAALLKKQAEDALVKINQTKSDNQKAITRLKGDLETRATGIMETKPDNIAKNQQEAMAQAMNYLTYVKGVLADGKLSLDELKRIGQLGANAEASLNQFKIPMLKDAPDAINGVTQRLAHGEIPQAREQLNTLEKIIPRR